jgi:hypothetical protein
VKYTSEWPFGIRYDAESHTSTVFNRRHEGICRLNGKYPRCDLKSAVPCDREPRQYGAGNVYLHRDDANSGRADPAVRQRLRSLLIACPVLAAEIERRQAEKEAARPAPQSHADLVAATWP